MSEPNSTPRIPSIDDAVVSKREHERTESKRLELYVEGQNEHISTLPSDIETDVAKTADAIDSLMMGIEDAS